MKKQFGMGMDLMWNSPNGFMPTINNFALSPSLKKFLKKNAVHFDHLFFSLQPRDYDLILNPKRIYEYFKNYDEFLEMTPALKDNISLHHTFLNMGSMEYYPREKVAELTNILIDHYKLKWVNEDLGIWSIKGKNLPYPLPPVLNNEGLKASINNVAFYKKNLLTPLYVEFPGFSDGHSFFLGKENAFDFYKMVIEESDAHAVLDTGHILSYQWILGHKGAALFDLLEDKLPFDHCKEIHLSGCSIVGDKFMDFHHGIILDEQLALLKFLIKRCKKLESITFEDPKFDQSGNLIPKSIANFKNLQEIAQKWKQNELH